MNAFSILIVDDDLLMRDMLPRKMLKALAPAPHILTASTPEEGLRLAEAERPTVVLCDFNLRASMDGLEVLDRVGALAPDAVRILFSGHTPQEIGPRLHEAGVDGFVEKPLRLEEMFPPLLDIIRRVTGLDVRTNGSQAAA